MNVRTTEDIASTYNNIWNCTCDEHKKVQALYEIDRTVKWVEVEKVLLLCEKLIVEADFCIKHKLDFSQEFWNGYATAMKDLKNQIKGD